MSRVLTPKERSTFEQLCKLKQGGVMNLMRQFLNRKYGKENVISNPAFLVAKGDIPVALIAHADTVFSAPPKTFFYDQEANVLWSPDGMGADDRAGIFAITRIVATGRRPHIIITTDEESGCVGATKLISKFNEHPFNDLKFMIQLDRRGFKDSVYYDCANDEFEKFINTFGFETAIGSLSDISVIAPMWEVAAVNFSIGYQEEHSHEEHLYVGAMFETIDKVNNILDHVHEKELSGGFPVYEYVENRYAWRYGYGYPYEDGWWDDGYNLIPGTKSKKQMCCFCGNNHIKEDMLYIYYDEQTAFYICQECYAQNCSEIEWCSSCQKGWFLTQAEVNGLGETKQRLEWKCRMCNGGVTTNVSGDSRAGKQSTGVVAESGESADGRFDEALARGEESHDFGHEWAGL